MITFDVKFSRDNLVAPGQVAWASWTEGVIEVSAKIVRKDNGGMALYLPSAYRRGASVQCIRYLDKELWLRRQRQILALYGVFNAS